MFSVHSAKKKRKEQTLIRFTVLNIATRLLEVNKQVI
jgi:hypothetical protein